MTDNDKRIAELEACLGDSQESLTVADERITYLETMLDRAMTALGRGKDE